MKRLTYSICLLIISITALNAQNNADAERIITNLLSQIRTNAVAVNFTLKVSEKNAVNSQSGSGTFTIKANKFVLEMDRLNVWFDGKTQWSYMKENNEVSLSEPTEAELVETNPMAILSAYKEKCLIKFSKTTSTQNHIIDLTPKDKRNNFTKIEVQIAKSTGNLVSIKMIAKNGQSSVLTLTNYRKGVKVADDIFVFNKTKFKGVTVNDLR
jgi:chaperone LolA